MVKRVYLVTKTQAKTSSWAMNIQKLLNTYGLSRFWDNHDLLFNIDGSGNSGAESVADHKSFWKRFLSKIILQHEEQCWWKSMNPQKERNKLRTYIKFKKKLRVEKYLLSPNSRGRVYHTSLRNGTNVLEIEKGRWKGIPRKFRYCTKCKSKQVEDEYHFLVSCPVYHDLRDKFYQSINLEMGF